jgi:hypothetical protein
MSVTPISTPLDGEHVVAVTPAMTYPNVAAGWARRLRLFTGRALDATALIVEQDSRAGRLALLGQTRAPGVLVGLDVALERGGDDDYLHVTAGAGLLASGEDVVLGRALRVARGALGAIDPAARAAVLVLVPVIAGVAGRFDPDDPCAIDPSEDAFADAQRVDGVQLALLPWQDAWAPLDAARAARNPLAWTAFELERALPFGEVAPWAVVGVPLALIGLDGGKIAYVDRHAVARTGGHAPMRTPLVGEPAAHGPGPALRQARLLQLVDHLADLRAATDALPTAVAAGLGLLPPAGVVPREAVSVAGPLVNHFFPPTWRLRAAPIPREQLDAVLARAGGLAPLATAASEEALVLVPVPQAVYEPGLLRTEVADPIFAQTIAELVAERSRWLGHRRYLRTRRLALVGAIDPTAAIPAVVPDPAALEPEGEAAIAEDGTDEVAYDTQLDGATVRASAEVELATRLADNPAISGPQRELLAGKGVAALIEALRAVVQQADDTVDFGFLSTQAHIYRVRQHILGSELALKLTTSPVLATIAKGETAAAQRQNIVDYLATIRRPAVHAAMPAAPPTPGAPPSDPPIVRAVTLAPPMVIARAAAAIAARPVPTAVRLESTGLTATRAALLARRVIDTGDGEPIVVRRPGTGFVPSDGGGSLDDVRNAPPIVGGNDYRNVTVGQRIDPPPSSEARQYALATRQELIDAMIRLRGAQLALDDVPVFALLVDKRTTEADKTDPRTVRTFGEVLTQADADGRPLKDFAQEKPPNSATESVWFNDVVTLLEGHIATLRALEGRIAQVRAIIDDCVAVVRRIRASQAALDVRLEAVEHEVADRRGAVATARALAAEEDARVARINARRAAVLAQHVQVLAYVRPRFFAGVVEVPQLALEPALTEQPVPACLAGHDDAPAELGQLIAVVREAPLAWLKYAPPYLRWIDRVELLHGLVLTARQRAGVLADTGFELPFARADLPGRFGRTLSALGRGQLEAVWHERAQSADLDLRRFVGLSWEESRLAAIERVSLGDLIEGSHGRTAATAAASAELGRIEQVAGCLWARIGAVTPAIRLAWAEALNQFVTGERFTELTALPRWREVAFVERRELELLAAWLLDRVAPTVPAAVGWMHDLVRVCILLASHAPVDQIIAGDVIAPAPAGPGHLVPVQIDPVRIRIGMHVTFHGPSGVVARGIVEDLVGTVARTRIAEASTADLQLAAGTRARFAIAGSAAAPLHRGLGG